MAMNEADTQHYNLLKAQHDRLMAAGKAAKAKKFKDLMKGMEDRAAGRAQRPSGGPTRGSGGYTRAQQEWSDMFNEHFRRAREEQRAHNARHSSGWHNAGGSTQGHGHASPGLAHAFFHSHKTHVAGGVAAGVGAGLVAEHLYRKHQNKHAGEYTTVHRNGKTFRRKIPKRTSIASHIGHFANHPATKIVGAHLTFPIVGLVGGAVATATGLALAKRSSADAVALGASIGAVGGQATAAYMGEKWLKQHKADQLKAKKVKKAARLSASSVKKPVSVKRTAVSTARKPVKVKRTPVSVAKKPKASPRKRK